MTSIDMFVQTLEEDGYADDYFDGQQVMAAYDSIYDNWNVSINGDMLICADLRNVEGILEDLFE